MKTQPQPAMPQGEPVAWLDLSKMSASAMVYATGWKSNDKQSPLYTAAPSQGFKPVGYLRSDEFDGHVFEPIDGTWPFDELLFSLSTSPEPVQAVTLTDEEANAIKLTSWTDEENYGAKFCEGFNAGVNAIIAALRDKEGRA